MKLHEMQNLFVAESVNDNFKVLVLDWDEYNVREIAKKYFEEGGFDCKEIIIREPKPDDVIDCDYIICDDYN